MRTSTIRLQPRHARWGCLGIALLLALGLGLGLATGALGLASVFRHLAGGGDYGTVDPPGDPRAFDPVASYPEVARHAGAGVQLLSFTAVQVAADGRLDLRAAHVPAPRASYSFMRHAAAPDNAPPLGAGGSEDGRWWQQVEVRLSRPGQRHRVRSIGAGGQASYQYVNRGMQRIESAASGRRPGRPVPAPRCALRDLWAAAIARGVPAQAVATIEYDATGYAFSIPGTRWSFDFDGDCRMR